MRDIIPVRPVWGATTLAALLLLGAAIGSAARSPSSPSGRHIVERGTEQGVPACISCHGDRLAGMATIGAPAITGRPAAYIVARLEHYAGREGHNVMMKQVASALSPAERVAVAAYIARLPPERRAPPFGQDPAA